MHIFIDESGIFKRSSTRAWAVSCVGALTIPDEALHNVLNDFHMLKKGWGTEHVEIKGSDLNEKEIADTISLLSRYDVLFEVIGIDFVTARRPFKYADIRKIFKEHFKFDQSHSNLGLQMVDILTNAIRRALDGRLSYNGWCDIGGVMAQPIRGEQHVIQMIELSEANMKTPIVIKPPYSQVIAHVDKLAKPLLLD